MRRSDDNKFFASPVGLFTGGETTSGAVFSPCRVWRYSLWRTWDTEKPKVLFIGLNPSTADEVQDDPTIRRCIGYAKKWGYGGYLMANIFAFRATDPKVMKASADPIGCDNDRHIMDLVRQASLIVGAWGAHGGHMGRGRAVAGMIGERLQCLKVTGDGHPGHPLYISGSKVPFPFPGYEPE